MDPVSPERYTHLSKGINLAFWFWLPQDDLGDIQQRFNDEDFQYLADTGFTFVRLPIDLSYLLDEEDADLLDDEHLNEVDTALDRLTEHGLAVIVDIHSTASPEAQVPIFSEKLENDSDHLETFLAFWQSFARHLSSYDPELVFLELINEPVFEDDPEDWPPIMEKLVVAARSGAPDHTLLVSGARWSNIDTLVELEPLADRNIIYYFHFYEPMTFTHQGADWAGTEVLHLRDVPYPSSPEIVSNVVENADNNRDRETIRYYGEERWNAEKIRERIRLAARWAEQHDVRVICSEFGAYAETIPAAQRAVWIQDVHVALEEFGIGWAMWEYDGDFRLVIRNPSPTGGSIQPLPELIEALGLGAQ